MQTDGAEAAATEVRTPGVAGRVGWYGVSAVALALVVGTAWIQRELAPLDGSEFTFTLLAALVYWGLATFVFLPRLGQPAVRSIWLAFLLYALAAGSGDADAMTGLHGWDRLTPIVFVLSYAFMTVFFLAFTLRFPSAWRTARDRWVVVGVFALAAAAGSIHDLRSYAATPAGEHAGLPSAWVVIPLAAGLLAGLARLVQAGRRATLARERRQVKWILWGTALGAAPYVLGRAVPRMLTGWESPVPVEIDRAAELLVPAAFAIAVVKDRVFDIDVIIRRSVLYSLMALCGAGAFAALVALLGITVRRWTDVPGEFLGATAAALAVGVFVPLRRRFGDWVDRTFFGIRYRHDQALAALRADLAPARGAEDLAGRLAHFLGELLHPRGCSVVVPQDGGWRSIGSFDPAIAEAAPAALAPLPLPLDRPRGARGATAMPELETPALPRLLTDAQVRVVQPIAQGETLRGFVLLGPKQNERSYVEEELRVLAASALQASRGLERLALHRTIAEETMAREHLQDLTEQKAQFFARVAHDLRTPLTAIHWSLRNLQEGLAGPVSDAQADYLASVGAAERQLARLVDNLVDLSRLDLEAQAPPPVAVDMAQVVGEAATALRPLATARDNRIEISSVEHLPRVAGRPEAVAQIAMNLIDNALKYAPAGTVVEVGLATDGAYVALTVRDHGPGLPAGDPSVLFELFHQGPESAEVGRKGFGIGLHIVQAWTMSMGGTIAADNHPEGGARFECRLPIGFRQEDA